MQLLFILIFYTVLTLFIITLFANTYTDIKQANQPKRYKTKKLKTRVGIVVVSDNNEHTIKQLLRQIASLHMQRVKVVIIDNKSADYSVRVVKQFLSAHGNFNAVTIFKIKKNTPDQVLLQAAKKLHGCEYIIKLTGATQIEKQAVRFLRNYIELEQPQLPLVVPTLPLYEQSLSSIWLFFRHTSRNLILKSFSSTGLRLRVSSSIAVYPQKLIQEKQVTKYSVELFRFTPQISSLLDARGSMASSAFFLSWSLLAAYSVYVMMFYQNSTLLLLTFLLFLVWNCISASYATTLNFWGKIIHTSLSPLLYILTSLFWPFLLHQHVTPQSVKTSK